jgi:hypothetical protein
MLGHCGVSALVEGRGFPTKKVLKYVKELVDFLSGL